MEEDLRPPKKGCFAVHRRVNSPVYISFSFIYAYQISDFYLDNRKCGAFGPMRGPFQSPGGINTYLSTYFFTPYMPTKFQISILIIKNVGPSAACQGRFVALGGLTHTYAYRCIPFCMNIMHIKFQLSILITNKWDHRSHARAASRPEGRINPHLCMLLYSILYEYYAYKISTFYLNK